MSKEAIYEFKSKADQVEFEANKALHAEAVKLLEKGYLPRFVANKTFTAYKQIVELDKIINPERYQ